MKNTTTKTAIATTAKWSRPNFVELNLLVRGDAISGVGVVFRTALDLCFEVAAFLRFFLGVGGAGQLAVASVLVGGFSDLGQSC